MACHHFKIKKIIKSIFLALIALFFKPNHTSAQLISEVMPDPSEGPEWVELYNHQDENIQLQGLELWDELSSPSKLLTVQEDKSLAPGEFIVINLPSIKLNNGGDSVILKDSQGNQIDKMTYTNSQKDLSWAREEYTYQSPFLLMQPTPGAPNTLDNPEGSASSGSGSGSESNEGANSNSGASAESSTAQNTDPGGASENQESTPTGEASSATTSTTPNTSSTNNTPNKQEPNQEKIKIPIPPKYSLPTEFQKIVKKPPTYQQTYDYRPFPASKEIPIAITSAIIGGLLLSASGISAAREINNEE